ncbi:MAG: hypothetical protein U0L23_09825, partial [Lachnospiraceae bacterium]|nr:hypothetical protein [Lachnospiraceae bacterium]
KTAMQIFHRLFAIHCSEMRISMCDVNKYLEMYKEIKTLQPEDTLQLVMEAKDEEERDFFEMLGNFLLQQKQKKVIEGNLF